MQRFFLVFLLRESHILFAVVMNMFSESTNILYTFYRLDLLCAAGFVSMVGAVVFLVDLVLTIRFGMKGRFEY